MNRYFANISGGGFFKILQDHSWIFVSLLLLTGILGSINKANGSTNLYTYQAEAFLRGDFAVQERPNKLPGETLEYQGRTYIPFPPFPAALLTPFVAVIGRQDLKIYWISFSMAVLSCLLLYRILARFGLDKPTTAWILAGFALGTGYWQILRGSEWVWLFAQVTAVLFILLSIHEAMHGGRGWLAGLWLGMAFLSRQLSIYAVFFIPALLWNNEGRPKRLPNLSGFLAALGVSVLIYLGFNYYRFDTFGSGYEFLNYDTFGGPGNFLGERVSQYGIFDPVYFVFNAAYMFVQGYHIEFTGGTMLDIAGSDRFGASLLAASPFVIAAFRAKGDKRILLGAWAGVLLPLLNALFYHNNGYIQYNTQRFTLDFMPVLILLVALGYRNSSEDLRSYWKGMIVYSILLNALTNLLPVY